MKKFIKQIFIVLKSIIYALLTIFVGLIAFFVLFVLFVIILSPILPKSDYCLEDGDCKIGRIIIVDGKEIKIDKNTCLKNNWIWHDKGNYCKIKNTKFHPKEVIYD